MVKEFELTASQQKEIETQLKNLLELCQIHQVPMFACAAIKNKEGETLYNNIVYGGKSHNMEMYDDQIQKHILIANGFAAVPKREEMDFDLVEEDLS